MNDSDTHEGLLHDACATPRFWSLQTWFNCDCAVGCSPEPSPFVYVGLKILDSRWMTAMRSLMATTMRELATVMPAGRFKVRHERAGKVQGTLEMYMLGS